MAALQREGQNLPPPCVCYPKDPMWNRVNNLMPLIMCTKFPKDQIILTLFSRVWDKNPPSVVKCRGE